MTRSAHVLAPACAWAESTQPKQRSKSIASRLGNAIRALKPPARRSTEEKVCVINADALTEIQECNISKLAFESFDEDDISTQSGCSSRRGSFCSKASDAMSDEDLSSLPGSIDEISMPSTSPRKSEIDELALMIADRAQCKFSGRVYQDVRNAFLLCDVNGDGKLTQAETMAFFQHFDLSPEIALRFFTWLDPHETGLANWSSFMAKSASVFNKKTDFQLNAGVGRKMPAIR
jgi:hypothetical protein